MRSNERHSAGLLTMLVGTACMITFALLNSIASGGSYDTENIHGLLYVRPDTDSVAVKRGIFDFLLSDTTEVDTTLVDSLLADSLTADTLARLDTGLAAVYLPPVLRDRRTAALFPRKKRPLSARIGTYWRHEVQLDSTDFVFRAFERIGEDEVRYPLIVDFDTYRRERLQHDLQESWRTLSERLAQQRSQRSGGGLGFNIVVPGGRQSAFTSIFGRPEVDLRINGQADITAGFDYRKSDQQVAISGRPAQLDPDFKQDLRLGITGTIGDKLQVDVNWDTENQFEYQNQLKLQYSGYEDEIIQSIEAGNVMLNTPSRLIRGGQSLFGIKSELQLGGLNLITVVSQQEGQANELSIEGGSETTEFDLQPTDYDQAMHFFLGYYFRNRWEPALSLPPNIIVANGFERITDIEVWKLMPTSPEELNVRQVVAMVDLGEPVEMLEQANAYTATGPNNLPTNDIDQYSDADVDQKLRDGNATPTTYLSTETQVLLKASDYQAGRFKKLIRGRDFDVDEVLGYISLRQRLQESEALAVSYRFVANGRSYQVGDFSTETGGASGGQNDDRLVLKLLRPVQLRQPSEETDFNPPAWYLELRNIYNLPGGGLNQEDFEIQIVYESPGSPASKTIAEVTGQQTLLQALGMDRLNEDGAPNPDDLFDFLPYFSIDPSTGQLIFPYLEPFGDRVSQLIEGRGGADETIAQREALYVFSNLYMQKKENARRDTQLDVYRIRGSNRGSVQSFYDLRAYSGLIEGSVNVTSGGSRLTEGVDYTVDYQGGTVNITNPAHLTSGREINITYEQNSFFNLQKKTLLGARADYNFGDPLQIGATFMRLNQKSPIDKFRIGEEPISNIIWGMDGILQLEPRWLTRAIDALPFVQTREPSSISITGEFAQLRPGNTETVAFDRTRRDLRKEQRDFKGDELSGISYLDDFEGFENTYSLRQPGSWRISSPPDSLGRYPHTLYGDPLRNDSLRTTLRGTFSWYQLNRNIINDMSKKGVPVTAAVAPVLIQEVFPTKDVTGEVDPTLQTLDIYLNPHERGPYNYTTDLREFLDNPSEVWGGMMQRLPEGYTDFGLKNIEFVEFVFRPFADNTQNDPGRSAKMYIDLGSISEDVIPNAKLNNEDGISLSEASPTSIEKWGRLPTSTQNSVVDVEDQTRRTEDLGLDGLASYDEPSYDEIATESHHFRNFLNSLDQSSSDGRYRSELAKAMADPSGDDYYYFANAYFDNRTFYPGGATFQQRFSRWFPGQELNAFESQNKLANTGSESRGNSRIPDSEDLNINSTVDTDNSYFQYEIPLSKTELDSLAAPEQVNDYIVTEIVGEGDVRTGWYQVRIPVRDFTRQVGQIQDFSLIESIRVWTTGHAVPVTIRLATVELVGSQWQKSDQITMERETPADTTLTDTRLTISSINNEENSNTYRTPIGTIISQTRLANGSVQQAREQAMVMRAENLMPGKHRAIFKTQREGLDLLKYSNLRMFIHMHGKTADGYDIETRDKVKFFIRLGSNETNDYYEYEMPLSPSLETSGSPDDLWQTAQTVDGETIDMNSVNIVLGALNQLKVIRDENYFRTDSVFWNDLHDAPINPPVEQFAAPGTRLGIKGNPSLGRVNTIVMGIRNGADSTAFGVDNIRAEDILEDVIVWVNEMRVTGYDETNGWSALANADIKLADLAMIRASFTGQTDGFGSLSSTLDEREQNNLLNWSVTTDLNVDKFIPERFGWTIPFSYQIQSNTSTPRYSPQRGDIRLDDLLAQIDEDEEISVEEREVKKQEAFESAQTYTRTRSVTARVQKSGSRTPWIRTTIDGISLNYSLTNSDARNPSQEINDSWRWSSNLGYRFSSRRPKTLRPFWFLENIPVIKALGNLRFNYLPQAFSATASASRNFTQTRDRRPVQIDTTKAKLPESIEFPMRQQHSFSHRRNVSLQYNPFDFLNLSFDTDTDQSFNAIGVDTLYSVVVLEDDGTESIFDNMTLDQAVAEDLIDEADVEVSAFAKEDLYVLKADQVFNRFFSGDELLRTDKYGQQATATFRPTLPRSMNWLQIQDVSYSVQYSWQNGSVGRNTGANVSNQVELRGGLVLRPQEFFRKFGFYERMEEAQREAEADKQQRRRQQQQAREQRREERRARKEQERLERERLEELEALGQLPEEEEEIPPEEEEEVPPEEEEEVPPEEEEEVPPEGEEEVPPEGEDVPPEEGEEDEALEGEEADSEEETSGRRRFRLPLPSPVSFFRQLVLGITGIRDINVSYNRSQRASSSNVGTPIFNDEGKITDIGVNYSMLDAFKGFGPSMRYRFGLDRQIGVESRIIDPTLQVTDVLNDVNRIQARTSLSPTQTMTINVTWNVDWDSGLNLTFRPDLDGSIDTTLTDQGSNRASVWAFKADYLSLFERQLEVMRADENLAVNPLEFGDENGDGRVVLTNKTVVDDFLETFLSGAGTIDQRNLIPFPMPGWQVNYTGISDWPLINRLVQSATIRHGYTADYSTDYRTNTLAATGDTTSAYDLGPKRIIYTVPEYEVSGVRINERYQPFIGLDLTWQGRLQTNFAWNRSNSYSLSSSLEVSESKTSEFTFSGTFQKQGLKIPLLPIKRLNNRVSFSLTVGRTTMVDQRYNLRRGLTNAILKGESFEMQEAIEGDNISIVSASTRLTVSPQISYQFSNRVNASFQLRYENFQSEDSRQPSTTTLTGGFNFRVSITN